MATATISAYPQVVASPTAEQARERSVRTAATALLRNTVQSATIYVSASRLSQELETASPRRQRELVQAWVDALTATG